MPVSDAKAHGFLTSLYFLEIWSASEVRASVLITVSPYINWFDPHPSPPKKHEVDEVGDLILFIEQNWYL